MKELVIKDCIRNYVELEDELDIYDHLIQIYCVFQKKQVPISERTLLAYYMKWGISKSTEKLYMKDFNRKPQVVSNLKYSLVNNGLLIKRSLREWVLPPQFAEQWPDSLTIVLELNVTK